MNRATRILGLTLALASLGAAASAQTTYPYNRAITGVDMRPVDGHPTGVYELVVSVQLNVGNPFPGGGQQLDLSAELEVSVDGVYRNSTPLDALAMIDGGGPCEPCFEHNPCGQINGFNAFCVTPPQLPGEGCYCTSDVFLPLEEYELVNPGSTITVEVVTFDPHLPEVFIFDDRYSFSFLGANYCVANANSTGEPALMSATKYGTRNAPPPLS